mmetsp:Transcript_3215/g.6667  ORF Transcript_3215/g.6667 Transcript_3215/m.6667 type:complete len:88 (-) Transcript_3215:328-591(-)
MASGFGIKGGLGRCYPFFATFKECMISVEPQDRRLNNEKMIQCIKDREDYMECLHHGKEHARIRMINAEYLRQQKEAANPTVGGENE